MGKSKRADRAFHPLEQVRPHQMNEAFFPVNLLEYRAAGHLHVILAAILLKLVRQDVFQGSIRAEIQAANVPMDLFEQRE